MAAGVIHIRAKKVHGCTGDYLSIYLSILREKMTCMYGRVEMPGVRAKAMARKPGG